MLDDDLAYPIRVTDLKQWAYCPRVFYYHQCLPRVRPVTYKMRAGVEAGHAEEGREARRSLRAYGLSSGDREFDVPVRSARLGLRGQIDMVITVPETGEVIVVDYKLSTIAGRHFQLQLAAYADMLGEVRGVTVRRGFLYSIPDRRAEEIRMDRRLIESARKAVEAMRRIAEREEMPPPVDNLRKCVSCEFRRFCNDVL